MNIVGEHIDYLGGSVLPFACDRELRVAITAEAEVIRLRSGEGEVCVPLDGSAEPATGWGRHVWAVAKALRAEGFDIRGCTGEVTSTIPVGAGMSSSTALEVGVALALTRGQRASPELLQRAEQLATGVPCGVMDQTTMLRAREGHAILLDCSTGAFDYVPVPDSIGFVVIDTGTRRQLSDGRYAHRRAEAEAGHPNRRRHAQTEQRRVYEAAEALRSGDVRTLGAILDASHASLRDEFEVSSHELDLAVQFARDHRFCHGARLMGAGFAGCVLAAVDGGSEKDVSRWVALRLRDYLPKSDAFPVRTADSADELPPAA